MTPATLENWPFLMEINRHLPQQLHSWVLPKRNKSNYAGIFVAIIIHNSSRLENNKLLVQGRKEDNRLNILMPLSKKKERTIDTVQWRESPKHYVHSKKRDRIFCD